MYISSWSWMFGLCTFRVRRTRKLRKCFFSERNKKLCTLNPLIETTDTDTTLTHSTARAANIMFPNTCLQLSIHTTAAYLWNYAKLYRFRLENVQFFSVILPLHLLFFEKKIVMQTYEFMHRKQSERSIRAYTHFVPVIWWDRDRIREPPLFFVHVIINLLCVWSYQMRSWNIHFTSESNALKERNLNRNVIYISTFFPQKFSFEIAHVYWISLL